MIAVLSPAKSLDFETEVDYPSSKRRFSPETNKLIDVLKDKSPSDLQNLMDISDQLAQLNVERFNQFRKRNPVTEKQAIMAFQGDVYQGMQAELFSNEDLLFAQDHIRILSGLYGLLRPLDLIQPYRLEMGTNLRVEEHTNLYAFWDNKITKELTKDLRAQDDQVIINLASNEYFKAVKKNQLKKGATIVDVEFKDFKNGKYKIISFFAKKARGLMASYIVKNKISDIESLKGFDEEGYYYDQEASGENHLVFKRN